MSTLTGAARRHADLYLRPEQNAHYNWRLGIGVAAIVGLPIAFGVAVDERTVGVVASLAAWFVALAIPEAHPGLRLFVLGRRAAILTVAFAAGLLASPSVGLSVLGILVLGMLIPVPGMTITPLVTFVMGLNLAPGTETGSGTVAFGVGACWAVALMMVPFVGGRYAAERPPRGPRRPIVATVHGHVRSGSPEFRYAAQAAICCAVAYVVLKLLDWPHESWAIVGILTTLRPTWEATHARVVKRSVGMVGGAVLTAVMLAVVAQTSVWVGIVTIAVFGGLARPLRQFNYGYWPIFGTPVLLLLVSVTDHFHTIDAVYRLGNNLLGAAVTLAAVNLLWPHRVQHPRGGFRQERSA